MRHPAASGGPGSEPVPFFLAPHTGDKPTDDLIVHLLDSSNRQEARIAAAEAAAAQAVAAAEAATARAEAAEVKVASVVAARQAIPWIVPTLGPIKESGYTFTTPFDPRRAPSHAGTMRVAMPGFHGPHGG